MFTLKVQNFGVLKDIDIELNKTNLFIGENGSGKSVLAKLITIVTNEVPENFLGQFKEFNIDFITEDTIILFKENDNILLDISHASIKVHKPSAYKEQVLNQLMEEHTNYNKVQDFIGGLKQLDEIESQYIPAERNLISIFNQSISNFISAKIPLPDTLLKFSSQYNNARKHITELELLNMKYISKSGQDRIYYDDKNYLPLEHSSSGIQSALPMYLVLKYLSSSYSHIIIEEPEQNLYPKAQMDTIKYIIQTTNNNDTHIMTHSPYVLSTLNILLFAYKASNTNKKLKKEINKIIPESQHINPDEFSAYFIKDGKSKNIKSQRGLISENSIDDSSDLLDDEFSELMDIYSEYKND